MNELSRFPNWMRDALGLVRPDVPSVLDTAAILPTVQIGATSGMQTFLKGGSLVGTGVGQPAAFVYQEAASQEEKQFILHMVMWSRTGTAGVGTPTVVALELVEPNMGWSPWFVRYTDLKPDDRLDSKAFMGLAPLWIPPGFGFRLKVNQFDVGQQVIWRLLYSVCRAGFMPPL